MPEFAVTGADQFLRLSKALKAAGQTELRKELNKKMRTAARPLIPKARESARARLPQSGGLARRVASSPIRVQTRTGRDPGVRIVVSQKAGYASRSSNTGTIRHPVFGNRQVWVTQRVPAHWFDEPMEQGAPSVLPGLQLALESVAAKVVASV